MKFKLDENMPFDLAPLLKDLKHDADDVVAEGLGGADDNRIIAAAIAEQRILLTFDLDFADIRRFPPGSHFGIVVFRLQDQRWKTLAGPIHRILKDDGFAKVQRGLAIVDESRIRFKRPKT